LLQPIYIAAVALLDAELQHLCVSKAAITMNAATSSTHFAQCVNQITLAITVYYSY
jgi:hypothetical protein